jgi:hypothetical protein
VVNILRLVTTLLIAADVRKSSLATVPALLPVFRAPGTTPIDDGTSSNRSPTAISENHPTAHAELTRTDTRKAAPVLEIDTAQLRAAKIWAHNIARKLFQRSSPDEASFRFRHRT